MTQLSNRIKRAIVEDFRGLTEVPTENLEINNRSITFDHWIDLDMKNFDFFISTSEPFGEHQRTDWIKGRVKHQITVSFDDLEFDEPGFTVYLDPVLIEINECSDESLLNIYREAMKTQIYDEFCNGLDVDANNILVKIEFY